MGKPTICLVDSNCEADQRLCFRYTDSTIPSPYIKSFKLLALCCDCTGRFMSDLVGNHIAGFPHETAHFIIIIFLGGIIHKILIN